jgi:hypothetical protein
MWTGSWRGPHTLVLGAGEASGKYAMYKFDTDFGPLKRPHTVEVGKQRWWVMVVELRLGYRQGQ